MKTRLLAFVLPGLMFLAGPGEARAQADEGAIAPAAAPQQMSPQPTPGDARRPQEDAPKQATLRLGDEAPALKVRWIKGGKPINFKDGKVHLLEFWATWCGPCKRNMPHVSHLAQKHRGKLEVISVSVWERAKDGNTPYEPQVIDFVNSAGMMMDHAVAMDTADNFMVTNWVEASGQTGIPAAVLIDRQGKVAWIGVAFGGLDEAIDLALENKLDAAAAQRTKDNYKVAFARRGELMRAANAALDAGKPDEALQLADAAMAALPVFANSLWSTLYRAHRAKSAEQAAAFVDTVATQHATAPIHLQEFARTLSAHDPAGALKLLLAGARHTPATDMAMSLALAEAYAGVGDYVNALARQEIGIRGYPESSPNPQVQQVIDTEKKALEDYRTKAHAASARE